MFGAEAAVINGPILTRQVHRRSESSDEGAAVSGEAGSPSSLLLCFIFLGLPPGHLR